MDRPKRIKIEAEMETNIHAAMVWNDAIDACDAFLPDEDEIGFIVFKKLSGYSKDLAKEEWAGKYYKNKYKVLSGIIAKAIHKRLRGES